MTSIFVKTVSDLKLIRDYCMKNHPDVCEGGFIAKASIKHLGTKHAKPTRRHEPSMNDIRYFLRQQAKVNLVLKKPIDVEKCRQYVLIQKGAIAEPKEVHCKFKIPVRDMPHFRKIVSKLNVFAGRDGNWTTSGKVRSRLNHRKDRNKPVMVEFIIYNKEFKKENATFLSLI